MSNYSMCNSYVGYISSFLTILILIISQCCGWLVLACPWGLQSIFQAFNRSKMRNKFGLEGDECTDCLRALCCQCCALVQEEKEAKLLLGEGGNAVQGYQRTPEMRAVQ
jgi:Cys-rich protein (TIGR01571 family)